MVGRDAMGIVQVLGRMVARRLTGTIRAFAPIAVTAALVMVALLQAPSLAEAGDPTDADAEAPSVSVVIPTCNRPCDLERCLASVAHLQYGAWNVLVVDQSDTGETQRVVERFRARIPNLTYTHLSEKGSSRARNFGFRNTTGDIVAFLDDDCTVPPDWLSRIAGAFGRYPQAAVVFGSVAAVPHDDQEQYIPSYLVPRERVLQGKLAFLRLGGVMGASMYLRRSLCRRVPLMDVYAGSGSFFPAAGDRGYPYRLLRSGLAVVETPSITVEHYGARPYANGAASRLVRAAPYSQGALDMKFLRCGDVAAPLTILTHLVQYVFKVEPHQIILQQGPTHLAWPILYVHGLIASFRVPVLRDYWLWGRIEDYDPADLGVPEPASPAVRPATTRG